MLSLFRRPRQIPLTERFPVGAWVRSLEPHAREGVVHGHEHVGPAGTQRVLVARRGETPWEPIGEAWRADLVERLRVPEPFPVGAAVRFFGHRAEVVGEPLEERQPVEVTIKRESVSYRRTHMAEVWRLLLENTESSDESDE